MPSVSSAALPGLPGAGSCSAARTIGRPGGIRRSTIPPTSMILRCPSAISSTLVPPPSDLDPSIDIECLLVGLHRQIAERLLVNILSRLKGFRHAAFAVGP